MMDEKSHVIMDYDDHKSSLLLDAPPNIKKVYPKNANI